MSKSGLLKQIFLVRNSSGKTHKIVTLLGLKFKFKSKYPDKKIKKFFSHIRRKSVLVIEANCCHYEVIPGYVKYFEELGYPVDIIVPERSIQEFLQNMFPEAGVFAFDVKKMEDILASGKINRYLCVMFTSAVKYVTGISGNSPDCPLVTDYFPLMAVHPDKLAFVQHHMDRQGFNNNQIALADLHNVYSEKFYVVNPHYFGKTAITEKNENITKFIVVGGISAWRKNYDLLIDAVRKLAKTTDRFKIILVGDGNPLQLDEDIAGFFDIRGRLPYPEMFRAMEEADFFLCLLDPENPDHKRYISIGTSGSFQLIYGFCKPCLLHKYFADVYGFDNENALVYEENRDLAAFMAKAAAMDAEEYRVLQKGLKNKVSEVHRLSQANFSKMLKQMKL